jgi:small subunit ribosomal protein MRP21
MELRTATELLLLRPQSSPFMALLSTSTRRTTARHAFPLSSISKPFVCRSCRHFSTSLPKWQQASTKAPTSRFKWDSNDSSSNSTSTSHQGIDLDSADVDILNEAMDFSPTPDVAQQRHQHFKSKSGKAAQALQYSSEQMSGSAVTDTINAINAFKPPAAWVQPRQQQRPAVRPSNTENLLFPERDSGLELDSAVRQATPARPRVLHEMNIRLTAATGRTLDVDDSSPTDLAFRLRQLEILVARNQVRNDVYRQKFHERGGLKRKRLASQRWRKRFRVGFMKAVTRVQQLRRQGW